MKDDHCENKQIESLLTRAHMSEPSPQLKQRVTAEATKAWDQTSADIPWQIPLRRLAASAAAAVFIVWLAGFYSDYTLARWRSDGPSIARARPDVLDALPEMPYGPFAKHLAAVDRRSPVIDASALSNYAETVRKLLDETGDSAVPTPAIQPGDSSRLVPDRVDIISYS